jgi:hypothetical protein
MVDNIQQEAVQETRELSARPEEALYEELGLRAQDIFNPGGYLRVQQVSANFQQDAKDMFGVADLKEFGQRFWRKLEPQLIDLVCGANNEERKKLLQGQNVPDIAAAIVTAGIISSLAPPAWVVVLAAILAKKIAQAGVEALCEQWKEA